GNWVLFGKVQNNSSMPLSQIHITLYLYNSTGNIVGMKQGFVAPQNLGPMQNAIFYLQERPSDLLGIPKLFRISFSYQP
ncbi:MAG TPA: FxLYD domain-containing protein, partial [Methylomirabilota bacterium]|nr:FxLYD domain-containing protein [Methylomirabilota bacterium]